MSKADLTEIRAKIDALDAQWRELLGERASLVAQVIASKGGDSGDNLPIRPAREAAQLAEIIAWQKDNASVPLAALVAIWRELIGASLAQQGINRVVGDKSVLSLARDYFGAAIAVQEIDSEENNIAVRAVAQCPLPKNGVQVFARLPLLQNKAEAFCYGRVPFEASGDDITLVRAAKGGEVAGLVVAETDANIFVEMDGALSAEEIKTKYNSEWLGVYPRPPVGDK